MELQLVNLTKEFGNFRAVNNLNLTISNGVYGLLGVNGAGKTTTIGKLAHLLLMLNNLSFKRLGQNY